MMFSFFVFTPFMCRMFHLIAEFAVLPEWDMNFRLPKHVWFTSIVSWASNFAALIGTFAILSQGGAVSKIAYLAPILKCGSLLSDAVGIWGVRAIFVDESKTLIGNNFNSCREPHEVDVAKVM